MNVSLNHTSRFLLLAGVFILSLAAAIFTEQYYWLLLPFCVLLFIWGWQQSRLVFFLLICSLPFSSEFQFSATLGTDIPDEALMLLTAGLFFLYWIYAPLALPAKIWQHPLIVALLICMAWVIVTIVFSTHNIVSVKYGLAKCWYLGAFVLAPLFVVKDKKDIIQLAKYIAISMLAVTICILIKQAFYGFRFANTNDAVAPFFRNHVNYSAMLVCIIPIFFAFYRLTGPGKQKKMLAAGLIILLIALFFSYARGAWLALLAGWIAYGLIKKRLLLFSYIIVVIITLGGVFWIKSNDRYLQFENDYKTTIFHTDFREHLVATYRLKDVSTAERFYRWVAGVRMIGDAPLTGYGPNTFYEHYKAYASPAFKTWVSANPDHSTVHNYFLLLAIEQGLPGLFFFLLLLGALLYYVQRLYQRLTDVFYKTLVATTGVILTMIIVLDSLSDLIETDKIGSLFFLCMAMLVISDRRD